MGVELVREIKFLGLRSSLGVDLLGSGLRSSLGVELLPAVLLSSWLAFESRSGCPSWP